LFSFLFFLLFGVATFCRHGIARGAVGAVTPAPNSRPERDRRLTHALSFAALTVALGAMVLAAGCFSFSRASTPGTSGTPALVLPLMTGFSENVELGQIGEIRKIPRVVMRVQTGRPVGYERLRWRGIALTTFDGKRWTLSSAARKPCRPSQDGWIYMADPAQKTESPGPGILYTVYLEPLATDAIFVPGKVISLKGNFTGEGGNSFSAMRPRLHLSRFYRHSSESFHNYGAIRYAGFSRLPPLNATKLRMASNGLFAGNRGNVPSGSCA